MRNEPNFEIFHQAFSSRVELSQALSDSLKPPKDNLESLKAAHSKLKSTLLEVGEGDVEDQYRAYLTATDIFISLAEWKHAIRNAETDARRFVEAAKMKASEIDTSSGFAAEGRLRSFLSSVEDLKGVEGLNELHQNLVTWNLPLLLFANRPDQHGLRAPLSEHAQGEAEKPETTVAFLKFDINGEPAKQWNYLSPGTSYDLTIEVRVSNWPENANRLTLTPVTLDDRERDWLPTFFFEKPKGDGPFKLKDTGRAVLEIANSFGARPYEFLYAAEFDDLSSSKDIAVIGHRRLLLEGTDINSNPHTGFGTVDRHLLTIRDRLRGFPGILPQEIANAMIILGGLGKIAKVASTNASFEAGTSEKVFQERVSELLQNQSEIGEDLASHSETAGGITDLTFRGIPIELKVENSKVIFPNECTKFFNQTAAYAIGNGKRIGILCVLEASRKKSPVGVIEDDIEVFLHDTGKSSTLIVVVIVRGGFPKPSSYSR